MAAPPSDRTTTRCLPVAGDGARRLRRADRGGDEAPAWGDATVGGGPLARDRPRGQGALCCAPGRRPPRAPRDRRLGELRQGLRTLEGASGDHGGASRRGGHGGRGAWSTWPTAGGARRLPRSGFIRTGRPAGGATLHSHRPGWRPWRWARLGPRLARRGSRTHRQASSYGPGAERWGSGPDAEPPAPRGAARVRSPQRPRGYARHARAPPRAAAPGVHGARGGGRGAYAGRTGGPGSAREGYPPGQ